MHVALDTRGDSALLSLERDGIALAQTLAANPSLDLTLAAGVHHVRLQANDVWDEGFTLALSSSVP